MLHPQTLGVYAKVMHGGSTVVFEDLKARGTQRKQSRSVDVGQSKEKLEKREPSKSTHENSPGNDEQEGMRITMREGNPDKQTLFRRFQENG